MGDRVFAVATQPSNPHASQTPVILKDNLKIETLEVPGEFELAELTTTDSGWIALSDEGSVFRFDEDDAGGPLTVHEHESPLGPGPEMASDGEIWELGAPPAMSSIDAFGPAPGPRCYDGRPWIGGDDATYRWDSRAGEWRDRTNTDPQFTGFGCDSRGNALGLDLRGGLNRHTDDGCVARQTTDGWQEFSSDIDFSEDAKPHAIAAQPGDRPLLLAHDEGLLKLREDGSLARQFDGPVRDVEYVAGRDAMLLIQDRGVAAKYYGTPRSNP